MTEAQNVQGEIIKTVNKSQDAVIEAIRDWADAVQALTPKMPPVNVPFGEKLPKPEQLVASAYDFAEQLLSTQRKFAEEVVKATHSLTPGTEEGKGDSSK